MSVIPCLHFRGDSARAMEFYAKVFGATDLRMMRYAEAPQAMPGWKDSDRVMHGQMTIGGGVLMASDFPPGQGDPQQAVSVMFVAASADAARAAFARLAEGGAEIMPFGATFFSPGFGMVKDRFGTHWMISAPMQAPA